MRARDSKTSISKAETEAPERVVYFRITEPEYDALSRIAKSDERSVAHVLRRIVRKSLARERAS